MLSFYCYQISVITFRSFDNRIRLPHPIAEGSGHICLPEAKMYNNKKSTRVGSEAQYGPRLAGEILHDYLNNSNEPMAVAFREQAQDDAHQGWHPNTELCVDLKTLLRSDRRMVVGKAYQGVLRRDEVIDEFRCYEQYTFTETMPQKDGRRNPHVFDGRYITATRREDGSLRLNFKELRTDEDFDVEHYALGVYNEICLALNGLVGK